MKITLVTNDRKAVELQKVTSLKIKHLASAIELTAQHYQSKSTEEPNIILTDENGIVLKTVVYYPAEINIKFN